MSLNDHIRDNPKRAHHTRNQKKRKQIGRIREHDSVPINGTSGGREGTRLIPGPQTAAGRGGYESIWPTQVMLGLSMCLFKASLLAKDFIQPPIINCPLNS